MNFIKKLFKKKEKQTTFCYCPECNNELISSDSLESDKEVVTFKCSKCSHISYWIFDTPVPILIDEGVIRLILLKKKLDKIHKN